MPLTELPKDASIQELAQKAGIADRDFQQLTPAAQRLTKGQLLALWGARGTKDAIQSMSQRGAGNVPAPSDMGADAPLNLTLEDIKSVERVFGGTDVQAYNLEEENLSVACCCCPCCCASTVLKPARSVA